YRRQWRTSTPRAAAPPFDTCRTTRTAASHATSVARRSVPRAPPGSRCPRVERAGERARQATRPATASQIDFPPVVGGGDRQRTAGAGDLLVASRVGEDARERLVARRGLVMEHAQM